MVTLSTLVDSCASFTLDLYSINWLTSYCKISWSLDAARFGFRLFLSLWNLTAISAVALSTPQWSEDSGLQSWFTGTGTKLCFVVVIQSISMCSYSDIGYLSISTIAHCPRNKPKEHDDVMSSNGYIVSVTDPLLGESTGCRWIPHTKAVVVKLWCFLWSAPEQTVGQTIKTLVIWFKKSLRLLWCRCSGILGKKNIRSWQKRLLHPGMMCLFCDHFYFTSPRGLRTGRLV